MNRKELSCCPNCGGRLIGDGYTMVRHCEFVYLDFENTPEPDSSIIYCKLQKEIDKHRESVVKLK